MAKELRFTEFEAFANFVGLLVDPRYLKRKYGVVSEENGSFDLDQLETLKKLCLKHPELHIVTDTSDFDSLPNGHGITMDNSIRFVNRLSYYLANKSKDPCYLEETSDFNTAEDDFDVDSDS